MRCKKGHSAMPRMKVREQRWRSDHAVEKATEDHDALDGDTSRKIRKIDRRIHTTTNLDAEVKRGSGALGHPLCYSAIV